jgi:hypothetical protein
VEQWQIEQRESQLRGSGNTSWSPDDSELTTAAKDNIRQKNTLTSLGDHWSNVYRANNEAERRKRNQAQKRRNEAERKRNEAIAIQNIENEARRRSAEAQRRREEEAWRIECEARTDRLNILNEEMRIHKQIVDIQDETIEVKKETNIYREQIEQLRLDTSRAEVELTYFQKVTRSADTKITTTQQTIERDMGELKRKKLLLRAKKKECKDTTSNIDIEEKEIKRLKAKIKIFRSTPLGKRIQGGENYVII